MKKKSILLALLAIALIAASVAGIVSCGKVSEGDTSVTQEQIEEICKALTDAMDALPMKADKAALQELVNQAEEIDTGKYTEDSVAVFNEALEAAVKILKDENISAADQAAVDAAEEQLKTAIDGLVKKQPVTAVKTGDTGNMAVLWAMLLVVSAGACIYVKKRKTQ